MNVILLHGALGATNYFQKLQKGNKFSFHTFNFSGHGGKDFVKEFGIEQFAKELEVFIKDENLVKPIIFGYSMGAYVAVYLALQNQDLIGGIMSYGTKLDWNANQAEKESKRLQPELMKKKVPSFYHSLQKMHGSFLDDLLEKTAKMMTDLGENPRLNIQNVAKLSIPVKLCVGDRDKMVSIEETLLFYRNIPNAQLSVWANSEHLMESLDINKIENELLDFYQSIENTNERK